MSSTTTPLLPEEVAMRQAFLAKYKRDWNDPSSEEMRTIWAEAWVSSRQSAANQLKSLATNLRDAPLKGKIGDWYEHQKQAESMDSCAELLLFGFPS